MRDQQKKKIWQRRQKGKKLSHKRDRKKKISGLGRAYFLNISV